MTTKSCYHCDGVGSVIVPMGEMIVPIECSYCYGSGKVKK